MNSETLPVLKADVTLACFLLRAALGINILMHGAARILSGPGPFAASLSHTFRDTLLPQAGFWFLDSACAGWKR
jgi:hypothetical protein